MRNKSSKTVTFDLNNEIKLILNKHIVKFVARDGKWEMSFGNGSMEYAQIMYLITQKELASLQNLSAFLYFTKLIVSDVDFCSRYNGILKDFLKDKEVPDPVDDKEDDIIVKEEKVLHEQTPESIDELEKTIKKND